MDAWNVACNRIDAQPNSLRQDDEVCLFFFATVTWWHGFTRIFRLNATVWSFSPT